MELRNMDETSDTSVSNESVQKLTSALQENTAESQRVHPPTKTIKAIAISFVTQKIAAISVVSFGVLIANITMRNCFPDWYSNSIAPSTNCTYSNCTFVNGMMAHCDGAICIHN